LRPFSRWRTYSRDPALTLLHAARSITVITLRPPHERLIRQFESANPALSSRKLRLKELYIDINFLDRWYATWVKQISETPGIHKHFLVENYGEYLIRQIT
jgi:hypothetical protein